MRPQRRVYKGKSTNGRFPDGGVTKAASGQVVSHVRTVAQGCAGHAADGCESPLGSCMGRRLVDHEVQWQRHRKLLLIFVFLSIGAERVGQVCIGQRWFRQQGHVQRGGVI